MLRRSASPRCKRKRTTQVAPISTAVTHTSPSPWAKWPSPVENNAPSARPVGRRGPPVRDGPRAPRRPGRGGGGSPGAPPVAGPGRGKGATAGDLLEVEFARRGAFDPYRPGQRVNRAGGECAEVR